MEAAGTPKTSLEKSLLEEFSTHLRLHTYDKYTFSLLSLWDFEVVWLQ